jgi:moderate conductance mechanosensitive channel
MAGLLNDLLGTGDAPETPAAEDSGPETPAPEAASEATGAETEGAGVEGGEADAPEIPLLEFDVIAEVQDTTWLTELVRDVQTTPLAFFGSLFFDVALGLLLFGVLWFLSERWVHETKAAIARRDLWDEAQKAGELERTALLHRYLTTASAVAGVSLALGLFSLRYRVPVLQGLALGVQRWLLDGGLGRIIAILIVGLIVYSLLRVVRKTARALTPVTGQRFERQVARAATIRSVVESAARLVLITFFVLFVLAQVGVNVSTLLAGVGILGLAISFGAQSLVKDVITGFFILAEDQFGVGDVVTIAGFSGAVESLNLRITTLRALDGSVHVIPNGQIDKVTVASKEWSRSVVDIEVAYRADLDRALEVIHDEATRMSSALGWSWRITGPPEVTGVEALGPSGIVVRVLFKTLPKEQWAVGREFRRRIKNRFDAEGIEIPYPHTTLYWGDHQNPALTDAPKRPEDKSR